MPQQESKRRAPARLFVCPLQLNRLSTRNKVNLALDNPANYFISQSLNGRASDISNLLDSVGIILNVTIGFFYWCRRRDR